MAKKTIHTLEEIYPESAVAAQRERYEKSAEEFRSIFGDSEQLRYFSADFSYLSTDRKSTRLNSSHERRSRMPSSA